MAWKQDVTVNLSRLLRNDPHAEGEIEASGVFMPETGWSSGEWSLEEPLRFELNIRAVGGNEYLLTGRAEGTAITSCRRCLAPVAVDLRSDFMYSMEFEPGVDELTIRLDEDDDEVLVFGRPEVDFAVLIAEVVAVDLPLTVACPPGSDCQDLAGTWGIDRGPEQDERSPFAALKDFDPESTKE